MPLTRVETFEGKTDSHYRAILDSIHQALVNCLGIKEGDRTQHLYRLSEKDFVRREGRSDNYVLIEITLMPGRKTETKKKLFKEIADRLKNNPGINPLDVTIVLLEPPLENWGIRGGLPASEVDLGYPLNV